MVDLCPTGEEEILLSQGQASDSEFEVGAGTGLKLGMRLWLKFRPGLDLGWS